MIQFLLRPAKRLVVLLPGIVIAYFSVRDVFPYFHRRLPIAFAVLITYILGAYILVPALIRLFQIFRSPKHLPLYCVTPDGFASDPLNIGIVSTRRELIQAMEKAGWYLADPHTAKYLVRHVLSVVLGWDYPTAPVSNLYLFGSKQDLAFEIPLEGVVRRHHVRFWATTFKDEPMTVKSIHWHHRSSHVQGDNLLWVGAASLDTGIAPIRHNMQITHMIHPDTNQERELISQQLEDQGSIKKLMKVKLDKPYRLRNRALNGYLHTDGKMCVIWLKSSPTTHHKRKRD